MGYCKVLHFKVTLCNAIAQIGKYLPQLANYAKIHEKVLNLALYYSWCWRDGVSSGKVLEVRSLRYNFNKFHKTQDNYKTSNWEVMQTGSDDMFIITENQQVFSSEHFAALILATFHLHVLGDSTSPL